MSGSEAVEIGLATRVTETPRESALEMAREIASKSPDAIRAGKKLFEESWLGTRGEGFALEESLQRGLVGSPNQLEAVQANMEKRAPRFRDPG